MAVEAELEDVDALDIEGEDDAPEPDNEDEGGEDEESDDPAAEGTDDFAVEFDEEAEPAPENAVIRQLRAELREARATKATPAAKVEVGEKPTLEGLGYDEDKYEAELLAWNGRKADAERQASEADKGGVAVQASLNEDLANYARQKTSLKVRDYDVAEAAVEASLSPQQQVFLVGASDNPASLVYALWKHPAKLATLATIDHPIKFAVAVAKLEGSLKVTTKTKKAPAPEEVVRGSAKLSANVDKHREKLEKEAERSGDRSKIAAYNYAQKQKAR